MPRVLTYDFDEEPCEIIERNGNLTLVETESGEERWVAPFELKEDG